ncbi:hypothetical protein DMN91_000786 [Ooceraea biroi]|uniref:Uncharacterized protein n=1 Tax=Ooceraea biroi TaxID=2015173 RepID=A0A3L8E2S9_OOCBI|nr:uncharacterized protein LOC105286731 [Ooceraea biroi]RLU26987.1 hypothetical protein DMN91_000786 [Ooceraea biroi]
MHKETLHAYIIIYTVLIFSIFARSRRRSRRNAKRTAEIDESPSHKNEEKRRSEEYSNTCTKAHGDQTKNNLDPRDDKLNGRPNRKLQKKIEENQSRKETEGAKAKRDIIAENITKQGKRLHLSPVKRIPATSNFIYEFNPFTSAEQSNPPTSQIIRLRSTNNSDQKLPCAAKDTISFALNDNADFTMRKSPAVLPELNSRTGFVMVDPNSSITNSQSTCLPILSKEDSARVLSKQFTDEGEHGKIDREVKKAKSIWQALQSEKDWTKSTKQMGNARTRKLYEMLEKVTCEIDKVQRRYAESRSNHLPRSATILKTGSKSNLEKEAGVRDTIFPKRTGTNSEIRFRDLKNVDSEIISKDTAKVRFNEAMENTLAGKRPIQTLFSSNDNASMLSDRVEVNTEWDTDDYVISDDTNIRNKDRNKIMNTSKSTFRDNGKPSSKSYVEKYLQNYNEDNRDLHDEKETQERCQDMKSSANDIEDIFASLNIGSFGLFENFEELSDDMENCASTGNENRPCPPFTTDNTQVITCIEAVQEEGKIRDSTLLGKLHASDKKPMKAFEAKSTGTAKQSNAAGQDNTFIKMGLNVLNRSLSTGRQSQILQSEYLKKDLCS